MAEEKASFRFKSCKTKKFVRRRGSSESSNSDGEEINKDILQETIEIQKLRKRAHGVNAVTLAIGKKISKMDELVNNDSDPFKLRSGGLLTLDGARKAAAHVAAEDGVGEEEEKIVGTVFSKETRIRDEDEEMKKFIESEVEKRRGKLEEKLDKGETYVSPEDRALMSLPEHLRKSDVKRSEEMLSSQMLSGIPEVDLGIEEKIRNIEATEAAKKIAAEERAKGKQRPSEFVPTNLAVNFKQPNRFKSEEHVNSKDDKGKSAKKEIITQRTVVVGQMPVERVVTLGKADGSVTENDPMRATDDVHVQKFKKHFQRK